MQRWTEGEDEMEEGRWSTSIPEKVPENYRLRVKMKRGSERGTLEILR